MISPTVAGLAHFKRVFRVQTVTALAGAGAAMMMYGKDESGAMLAGGMVALANTLMLAWRLRGNRRTDGADAQHHLRTFYLSGLERLIVVGSLFAIGIGQLGLKPLPLLVGFVLGQLALIVSSLIIRRIE